MDNRLLILLAVVVVASGCAGNSTDTQLQDQNSTSTPSNISENISADQTITYTSSEGFQPSTVTVQQGDTVVWIAESGSMWVGSDRHPTHTQYSGSTLSQHCQNGDQSTAAFDQCSTGDRFSFTFEKTGEWMYHNHVNPGQTGTVVVE
jgi:plastocyanin